jgi:molybdenum cofactor biosynthesis enzyme MoaA
MQPEVQNMLSFVTDGASGKEYNCQEGSLPDDMYRQVIDEGRKHGLYSIALNGSTSEPLLNKELADMIVYAKKAGIVDIAITTNAHLLNEQISRKLIDSGLTRIMFSPAAVGMEKK